MDAVRHLPSTEVPAHERPTAASALDDPATGAVRSKLRHRPAIVLAGLAVGFVMVLAACIGAASVEAHGVAELLSVVAAALGLALFVALVTAPIRVRDRRRMDRALTSPWVLVELVAVVSAGDASRRAIVVLDPVSGRPAGTWLLGGVRRPRWLRPGVRQWAYLAAAGEVAVGAPLDRSSCTLLLGSDDRASRSTHRWAFDAVDEWDFDPPGQVTDVTSSSSLGVRVPEDAPRRWPDRPATRRERLVVLLAVAAVLVVAIALVVHRDRAAEAHADELRRTGSRTDALVVEASAKTQWIGLQFTTPQGWTYRVRHLADGAAVPRSGQVVAIVYDPSDPSDLRLADAEPTRSTGIAVLILVVGTIAAGSMVARTHATMRRLRLPAR